MPQFLGSGRREEVHTYLKVFFQKFVLDVYPYIGTGQYLKSVLKNITLLAALCALLLLERPKWSGSLRGGVTNDGDNSG